MFPSFLVTTLFHQLIPDTPYVAACQFLVEVSQISLLVKVRLSDLKITRQKY